MEGVLPMGYLSGSTVEGWPAATRVVLRTADMQARSVAVRQTPGRRRVCVIVGHPPPPARRRRRGRAARYPLAVSFSMTAM